MLTRMLLFSLMLIFWTLSACAPAPGPGITPTPPAAQLSPTPEPPLPTREPASASTEDHDPLPETPSPTVEPTPDLSRLPLPQYLLEVDLSYDRHHASVRQTIEYTNRSEESIDNLMLVVEPVYYRGVFHLTRLAWEDGAEVEQLSWEGNHLTFPLRQTLHSGEIIGLSIVYDLAVPSHIPSEAVRPIPFGYTVRQLNLVDWYPFIPPYRSGEGWLAHQPGFFGEHLVLDLADYTVRVRLLDERTDLMIAASAPEQVEEEWRVYRHERARDFALSISHQYRMEQTTVGDTTVASYYFSFHPAAGKEVLNVTARSVELYNELYGKYPRKWLAAVEADFLDGMEYDGLYFLSIGFYNTFGGSPAEYLTAIATHETAHQWWYGLVANDQALEPWLDEALCTYSERLYYERYAPEALKWWWDYRVNYYQPRGLVDKTIYNASGYRDYRDAVYLNGAWFLEKLRLEVGDEAFFGFLKEFQKRYQGQIATRTDFFGVLAEFTQADLRPLLEEYFSP
jgi:hypothetical protein